MMDRDGTRTTLAVILSVSTGVGVLLASGLLAAQCSTDEEADATGEALPETGTAPASDVGGGDARGSEAETQAADGGEIDSADGGEIGAREAERRDAEAAAEAPDEGVIPRDAIVDMTRARSGALCSSEVFLGCMGFDGTTCLSLSESAIERCLLPLPAEIDPRTLDNDTLEACPQNVYEEAGFDETMAAACFERMLDES